MYELKSTIYIEDSRSLYRTNTGHGFLIRQVCKNLANSVTTLQIVDIVCFILSFELNKKCLNWKKPWHNKLSFEETPK
jgi:hypothetical protein